MKKVFLIFLFCICFGHASEADFLGPMIENQQSATFKYYDNCEWILGLEDGSFWKVHILKEKRKRTWYEWWNKMTPAEWDLGDEYFFEPTNWDGDFSLCIYKSKHSVFPGYTHILKNEATGQKAFAQLIPFGEKHIPSLAFANRFFDHPKGNAIELSCKIESKGKFLNNIIFLKDDSCWRIFPFERNASSWTQWLKNVNIDQPDPMFIFQLSDWNLNDKIQVYFLGDDFSNSEKYGVNILESKFNKGEIFLIENVSKKHLAYARKVLLSELVMALEDYSKARWKKGYDVGYEKGYSTGYSNGISFERSLGERKSQTAYEDGYRDGYNQSQEDHRNRVN